MPRIRSPACPPVSASSVPRLDPVTTSTRERPNADTHPSVAPSRNTLHCHASPTCNMPLNTYQMRSILPWMPRPSSMTSLAYLTCPPPLQTKLTPTPRPPRPILPSLTRRTTRDRDTLHFRTHPLHARSLRQARRTVNHHSVITAWSEIGGRGSALHVALIVGPLDAGGVRGCHGERGGGASRA